MWSRAYDALVPIVPRRTTAILTAAGVLLAAGCTSSSNKPQSSSPGSSAWSLPSSPSPDAVTSATPPPASSPTGSVSPDAVTSGTPLPASSPTSSVSPDAVTSATPLPVAVASVPGAVPGVKLAINSLSRVDDKTLLLTITLTNSGSTPFSFNGSWREPGYGDPLTDRDLGGATLFDPAARQRYLVLRDAAMRCLCSTNLGYGGTGNDGLSMGPGDVMTFFAYFPSPPSSTSKLQVSVPQYTPTSVSIT